jgi:hypothetical protein
MTESEILEVARAAVNSEGWPWAEPVMIQRYRTWPLFGRLRWHVMTNASCRGGNVNIHIDDRTASVASKELARR